MRFPTTHWSLLEQATLNGDPGGRAALAEFYRKYHAPVLAFIRRRTRSPHEAEDLAQAFFVHVIEKTTLRRADATRGRFRSFLLGALMRFLAHARDRQTAAKRGGGVQGEEWSDGVAELAVPPPEVQAYDRAWAMNLLQRALAAVEAEYAKAGSESEFAVLRGYLPGSPGTLPYEESARRLGKSLGALKSDVHRLRERVRECLHCEIATTVSSPEDVADEMAYLGLVLRTGSA